MRSIWGKNYLALRRIFKAVIILQITFEASIWYMPNSGKGYYKTLVTQLAQISALETRAITKVLKATFV